MDTVTINIFYGSGTDLSIKPDTYNLGSQYDNMAKLLVFSRPEEFGDDSLVLRFKDRRTTFEPVDLGKLSEFPLTDTLTQWDKLSLQVAFLRDGGEIAHSDIAEFSLRQSIEQEGGAPNSSASKLYVDTQDAKVLAAAKEYADERAGTPGPPGPQGPRGEQGPPGPAGTGGAANTYTRILPVEGGHSRFLGNTRDIPATIRQVQAGLSPVSNASLAAIRGNLLDINSISEGENSAISLSTNKETGELTVTFKTAGERRLKITNGWASYLNPTPIPDAARAERIELCDLGGHVAMCGYSVTGGLNAQVNTSFVYSDAGASTILRGNSAKANGGFVGELLSGEGREVSYISLYTYTEAVPCTVKFKLMRSTEAISSSADYLPSIIIKHPLPALAAGETADLSEPFTIPAGSVLYISGDKPYRVRLDYEDTAPGVLSGKNYGGSLPAGAFQAADDFPFKTVSEVNALTFSELYALYDALMAKDAAYVTKEAVGKTASGKDLYAYKFRPAVINGTVAGSPSSLPKLTLTAGVHGNEKTAWLAPYYMFRGLVEGWKANPVFEYLRFHVDFAVVPLINELLRRTNQNGVNLNRNFYPNWEAGEAGDNYGSSSPLGEPESQAVYRFLASNLDSGFHIDCHNYWDQNLLDIYVPGADGTRSPDALFDEIKGLAAGGLRDTYRNFQRRYEAGFGTNYSGIKGNVGPSPHASGGSIGMQARALGIPSATLESRLMVSELPGSAECSPEAQRLALEHQVNLILAALRRLAG